MKFGSTQTSCSAHAEHLFNRFTGKHLIRYLIRYRSVCVCETKRVDCVEAMFLQHVAGCYSLRIAKPIESKRKGSTIS